MLAWVWSLVLSMVVIRPLITLVRVSWAMSALPALTGGWLSRLLQLFLESKLELDVMAGSGATTLSSRYKNAVFFEGVGTYKSTATNLHIL